MGGAKSLASDLERIDYDILISTNAHGCDIMTPNYVLAMDEQHGSNRQNMLDYLRARTDAPIISPVAGADYHLYGWPQYPRRLYSGLVAIWVAWHLGAKVVLLAGMDGYDGADRAIKQGKAIKDTVKCQVRALNGPMAKLFGQYSVDEKFPRYRAHQNLFNDVKEGVEVVVLRNTEIEGQKVKKGERWKGPRIRVDRLIRLGAVRLL
jgi:hypothetical protein